MKNNQPNPNECHQSLPCIHCLNIIGNLSSDATTEELRRAGITEPLEHHKQAIRSLFTFNDIPTFQEMDQVAAKVTAIVKEEEWTRVMIGDDCPVYLIYPLQILLQDSGIDVLYAFFKQADAESSSKVHVGFVEAF